MSCGTLLAQRDCPRHSSFLHFSGRIVMPRLFPALAAAGFLCASGFAWAQSPASPPSADTTPTVKLTAEQHHVIKEIVLKDMNVAKATGNTPADIGATVPESVQLHQFPPDIAN